MNHKSSRTVDSTFPCEAELAEKGAISIITIEDFENLAIHAPAWDKLALEAAQQMPMLSYAWVITSLEHHLQPKENWVCLFAYDGRELVGVLPLIIKESTIARTKQVKLRTLFNWHILTVDALIKPGYENKAINALLKGLKKISPSYVSLKFSRISENSPMLKAAEIGIRGFLSVRHFSGTGSYIDLPGSFEHFVAGLEKRFSRNLRRLERKIQEIPDLKFVFCDKKEEVNGCFEKLAQAEKASWKGRKGSAIMQSPALKEFYLSLLRRLSESGWLEWYFLSAGEKTIAAIMAIRFNRKLVIYKIGYDEAYASYSPGNKLFEKMLEKVFASGEIDEIDCLTTYAWNQNWNMSAREYHDLIIFPVRPMALLTSYFPAKVLSCIGHGSYIRRKCRIIINSANRILGHRGERPQNIDKNGNR